MATYVMADIHGEYEMFMEILDQINLKETDTLYVIGDILDRGPHPIKTLLKLMEMQNAICLVGNHELMALECLEFLCREITEESIESLDKETVDNLITWQMNGSVTTTDEFHKLDKETREELVWNRADYDTQYFEDTYVITGHTPTQAIEGAIPGSIYRNNNHIAIDCGSCFPGGRLAALCLDTDEEFYSSYNTE